MTISQALSWMKTLNTRHTELVALRNQNSVRQERLFGESQTVKTEPVYDVKKLDKLVSSLAREVRKLDEAIKTTNATVEVAGYTKDEAVLGEIE
jgi:hypothetical protein